MVSECAASSGRVWDRGLIRAISVVVLTELITSVPVTTFVSSFPPARRLFLVFAFSCFQPAFPSFKQLSESGLRLFLRLPLILGGQALQAQTRLS